MDLSAIDNDWIKDLIIPLMSLLISMIALLHSFSVNKFFAKNQLTIDQVKIVSELVTYLNKKKIHLKFLSISDDGSSRGGRSGDVTLFELLDLADPFGEFDDSQIFLDSNRCNEVFEFVQYLNNPLIPGAIAKVLAKFMNGDNFEVHEYINYAGNNILVIDSHVRYDYNLFTYRSEELLDKLIVGKAVSLKSWLSFKTNAEELGVEINKWLKSKQIDDLNIRTEFHPY